MSDYIYLEDGCADRHYCSRCGEPVFTNMGRRESHDVWIQAIEAHRSCEPPADDKENV
jgi:hypothetical protein